jgi:hypothetical protein
MKATLVVLFTFLLCSLVLAQELAPPQNLRVVTEPADKQTVIKKGDFAVSIKVSGSIARDQELDGLATKIVDRLQEKFKSDAVVIGCNLTVSVNLVFKDEKTGELKRALDVSVYTPGGSRQMPLYRIGKLPKSFAEADQMKTIDWALDQVVAFQCP